MPHPVAATPSLAGRAALAVVLMVGFYALALAVSAALVWVPYAEWHYLDRIDGRIALFCLAGAAAILWGVMPRIDRFEPPGPELREADQPALFAELRATAAAAGQRMPREVYLIPDLNAWVAQRGGVMGFGSHRVMGLGLSLMQVVTVDEMRAVLAHEFGHYHGGDTALGPWIYKTRAAIVRTLEQVSGTSELLALPFLWYGKAFLRITHAISRRQEFAADALAARVAGAKPLASALRAIHGTGAAFGPYWGSEVMPAISRGFRPPLGDGFRRFIAAPKVEEGVAKVLEEELRTGAVDPYDTHPPLRDRLAALAPLGGADGANGAPPASGGRPAASLLRDVEALEAALVDSLIREEHRGKLNPVAWEEAGERVWAPVWREQTGLRAAQLAGLTPAMLPRYAAAGGELAYMMGMAPMRDGASAEQVAVAEGTVGAALATTLFDHGFAVRALPGAPVDLVRGDLVIRPFEVLGQLASKALSAEAWRAQCAAAGIESVDLGTVAAPAAAAPPSGNVSRPSS
ncbi:MAG TPA: M48 family metallopeptidase [Gemmatimonadaceae bacterium]|nr:M48 family metallopeptidase [Gemmatimonadaceae bacterium]